MLQFVPVASCPVTGHQPGSVCFTPSHQVFTHTVKIPLSLLPYRLCSPSSLTLSLNESHSFLFIFFVTLHWTRSSKPMGLLYWRAQHWTQHLDLASPVLSREEGPPPSTCNALPNAAQETFGLFSPMTVRFWLTVRLLSNITPRSFFAKLLYSQ